jgi:hypothetical protein
LGEGEGEGVHGEKEAGEKWRKKVGGWKGIRESGAVAYQVDESDGTGQKLAIRPLCRSGHSGSFRQYPIMTELTSSKRIELLLL